MSTWVSTIYVPLKSIWWCDRSFSKINAQCCAVLSHVQLFATPWTVACQAPLSMGSLQARITCCHALLQGIFPTQGSNPGLPHCRQILYHLSHQGSTRILEWVTYPFTGSSWLKNQTGVSCIAFFTSPSSPEVKHIQLTEEITGSSIWFLYSVCPALSDPILSCPLLCVMHVADCPLASVLIPFQVY